MSENTGISWTDATWNPVTGCSKLSQGCKNCYALREWPRLSAPRPKPNVYTGRKFTDVQCHPERLDQPLRWSKPRRIFVNSMSDLFHEDVPFEFIDAVMAVMWLGVRHSYQVLTKRIERAAQYFEELQALSPASFQARLAAALDLMLAATPERPLMCDKIISVEGSVGAGHIPPTLWMGTSIEDQPTADERIPYLLSIAAPVIFVSAEPLLGDIRLGSWLQRSPSAAFEAGQVTPDMPAWTRLGSTAIDWVIAGGESGPHARPMHPDWVRSLRDQCAAAGVPFHFKQWGEFTTPRVAGVPVSRLVGHDRIPGHSFDDGAHVVRVGKKAAGRLLDGVEHNGFPEAS